MLRAFNGIRLRHSLIQRQVRRHLSAKDEVIPSSQKSTVSSSSKPKVMSLFSRKKTPESSTSISGKQTTGSSQSNISEGKAKPNLQSLIEKFKTDASGKAKSAVQSAGRHQEHTRRGQERRQQKTLRSMSVRDSFRMKEAERKGEGSARNQQSQNKNSERARGRERGENFVKGHSDGGSRGWSMDKRRARRVSESIIESVTSTIPSVSIANGADEIYEGDEDVVDQHHKRYQERLRRDKLRFNQEIEVDTDSSNKRGRKRQGKEGIKVPDPEPFGGSGMMNIAEMKARMASKLNNSQRQSTHGLAFDSQQDVDHTGDANVLKAATKRSYQTVVKEVSIPFDGLSIRSLASKLSLRIEDVKMKLKNLGESVGSESRTDKRKTKGNVNVNEDGVDEAEQVIEADVAELLVLDMGIEAIREVGEAIRSDRDRDHTEQELATQPRAPVVCVMGHVDHGKTTLLDALRRSNVADNEAGGITQKLSAFRVQIGGRQVAFLDTPGHAAFSTMRSHGVSATDLVVLVVAIDEGVKSQTKEALRTAKDAGSTIVVAITKCDKIPPGSARETAKTKIYSQLSEEGLVCEDFGGDTMSVEISAQSGENIADGLVEGLLLQADMLELEAATQGQCEAVVLDANMEKGRGVVADVLVRWGNLQIGDSIVVDRTFGKVRAMVDEHGKTITSAGPSTPVRLLGLRSVPTVGQELLSVESEAKAKDIVDRRTRLQEARGRLVRRGGKSGRDGAVETDGSSLTVEGIPTLPIFLKADGVGTLEALEKIVKDLGSRTNDINLVVVKAGVGDINRSEVEAAATAGARIMGFNVGLADSATRAAIKELSVGVHREMIIYRLEETLMQIMQALMPRERKEVKEGTAVVQKIFTLRDKLNTNVAGLIVREGKLSTSETKSGAPLMYRVTREGFTTSSSGEATKHGALEDDGAEDGMVGVVFSEMEVNNNTAQLKRFKDVVHVVEQGNDCGLVLSKFKGWQEGDIVHCYRVEYDTKRLQLAPVG